MKYREKSTIIDAIQFTGHNGHEIKEWSLGKILESPVLEPTTNNISGAYLQIYTPIGIRIAIVGDYIIKDDELGFYLLQKRLFEQYYERVEE